jgi:hypothetical protein
MPKYTIEATGEVVNIDKRHYKTEGGEGAIYIKGGVVFKICKPTTMIPRDKFNELAALSHPKIVKPESILLDKNGVAVGYTMRLVPNAFPLAQILTKSYREREGVTPEQMAKLVQQIHDGIVHVHEKKMLQVDGNELNYMVTDDHKEVYFIDVNSFQTPSHPALAIMPSIRDYSVGPDSSGYPAWTDLSDWFSYCVISWYMFTGTHPFRGKNPNVTATGNALEDHMRANKSVLDPETKFPRGAVYHPFEDVIPGGKSGAYMQWYKAVLAEGKRLAPPMDFQAKLAFAIRVKEIIGSNNFNIKEIIGWRSPITAYYVSPTNREQFVCKDHVPHFGNTVPLPAKRFRVGFAPKANRPIAAWVMDDKVRLHDFDMHAEIPFDREGFDVMSTDGRLYFRGKSDVFEITFMESGSKITPLAKPVEAVMEQATRMYQGVVIQEAFGAIFASMFPKSGYHHKVHLEELKEFKIIEAKYENNVLMVVATNSDGIYSRFVFRFGSGFHDYDVREIENIHPTGINFTVTEKGICVSITEEEKVEIFSNRKDSPDVKSIEDPAVTNDMRLCHLGGEVRFAQGAKLYSFGMK